MYLGSLDEEPGAPRPDRLLATGFGAAYARSEGASTGHVMFLQDGTLFAQAFDERSLQLRGEPVSLAAPVGSFLDGGFFSVSQNDVIAFRAPDKEFQLTWFDRRGNKLGTVGDVGLYSAVAISPDDSRVATVKEVFRPNIDQDIWMFDSSRTTMGRVTSGAQLEGSPVWSADGKRLIFTTIGGIGSLFEQVTRSRVQPQASPEDERIPHPDERLGGRALSSLCRGDYGKNTTRYLGPVAHGSRKAISADSTGVRPVAGSVLAGRPLGGLRLQRVRSQ